MARDARRTMSVTFTEEQTQWIESQINGGITDKGAVIKAAIDRAMAGTLPDQKPEFAVVQTGTTEPVQTACSFAPSALRELSKTVDILLKKYMVDHPGRKLSAHEESDLAARWDLIVALRKSVDE